MLDKELAFVALRLPDSNYVFQRRDEESPNSPNMLGFFGGGVEREESPYAAAVRELREETSIDFEDPEIKRVVSFPKLTSERPVHVFILRIITANFEVKEGTGAETYDLNEVVKRDDITDGVRIGCIYLRGRIKD